MVIRKSFFNFASKYIIFFWIPSHIGIKDNGKADCASKSALDCLVYPMISFNILLANILFPLGKIIGMVRSRTSFVLSGQSREIGSPPTGGAGRMEWSYTSDSFIYLDERSSTSV